MSTRSGNPQKKGQKYQNSKAFKVQFDTQAQEMHRKISYQQLCQRCIDQIKWKCQYNKYKVMGSEAKCNYCTQKCIIRSYMNACDSCGKSKNVCVKCLDPFSENNDPNKDKKIKLTKEQQEEMNNYITSLRERSRRTVLRKQQKNEIRWYFSLVRDGQRFVDNEDKPLLNLLVKNNDEEDSFGDDFNEEEMDGSDDN